MAVTTTETAATRPIDTAERRGYPSALTPSLFTRRISWGAIIAGVVASTFVQLLLGSLGGAVGASAVANTAEAAKPTGIGLGIWFVISTIVAMFVGGWVAGRLSGVPRKAEGTLHGFLTASLGALFVLFLLSSAVGGVFGSVAKIAGSGLQAAGSNPNVTSQAPNAIANARQQLGNVSLPQQPGELASRAAAGTAIAGYGFFAWLLIGCASSMVGGYASVPKPQRVE